MMKKKTALLFCIMLVGLLFIPNVRAASITKVDVYINGEMLRTDDTPRIINDTTYVPLRSICELFGADSIVWEEKTRTATVSARGIEIYVKQGDTYIEANGRYFASDEPIRNIGDRLYIPVRLIAAAFDSAVEWDGDTYSVHISDRGGVPVSGDQYYNSDEVYWLSRIIYAESGIEPFRGKIAVGNVVLNRVRSKEFPNTIYDVIFDKKYGTQFSPVANGSIYNKPNSDSIKAAKICLEGYSIDRNILYFMNPELATTNWISQNRLYAFRIGTHSFYY
ncbi:MAG: cell wall hydrolase [Eubacteriales bacterium]